MRFLALLGLGVLAVPVAGIVNRNRAAGVGWNLLGILDLVDAFVLGTLAVQGAISVSARADSHVRGATVETAPRGFIAQLRRGALSASQTSRVTAASTSAIPARVV